MNMTLKQIVFLLSLISLLALLVSCTSKTGIGRVYVEPVTPECVGELGDLGLYDYRKCDLDSIGRAWVLEKRTRMKYQNQIKVINE